MLLPSPKLQTAIAEAVGGVLRLLKKTFLLFTESRCQLKFTLKLHSVDTVIVLHKYLIQGADVVFVIFFTIKQIT